MGGGNFAPAQSVGNLVGGYADALLTDLDGNGRPDILACSKAGNRIVWRAGDPIQLGTRYCSPGVPNSSGSPGFASVTGSNSVAADDLVLVATDLPTGSNIGYFIMGQGTNTFTPPGSVSSSCRAVNSPERAGSESTRPRSQISRKSFGRSTSSGPSSRS